MTCAGNIQCYYRKAWQFDSLETGLTDVEQPNISLGIVQSTWKHRTRR